MNGAVIAALRIQPFIVTLATMIGVRGLAKWLSNNENIDIGFGHDMAALSPRSSAKRPWSSAPTSARPWSSWSLLARTVFGRHVRAIGDNEKAAEYAGPADPPHQDLGLLALRTALRIRRACSTPRKITRAIPNAGVAYELDAIAAVVIGGTRLSGGKGSISGTIVGTLFIGILTNMLRLNNVDSNVEMMIKAVIIVLAVAVQRERKSR